jgi:hypothetical protein
MTDTAIFEYIDSLVRRGAISSIGCPVKTKELTTCYIEFSNGLCGKIVVHDSDTGIATVKAGKETFACGSHAELIKCVKDNFVDIQDTFKETQER